MEARELRIGNYVKAKSPELHTWVETYLIRVWDLEQLFYNKNTIDIEPIPLTEDWLKKLGFHENNANFFKGTPFYIAYKDWIPEGFWMFRDVEVPIHLIKYVHELQNLYWCLTGEELEINLKSYENT